MHGASGAGRPAPPGDEEAMAGQQQRVSVTWKEGMRFEARTEAGAVTSIDGEGTLSPSPTLLLLESLAGCAGIDVAEILRKGRQTLEELVVDVTGTRREETPRYFTRVRLVFRIRGDVERSAAERAVELSLERYCSVLHSLRKELTVDAEVALDG